MMAFFCFVALLLAREGMGERGLLLAACMHSAGKTACLLHVALLCGFQLLSQLPSYSNHHQIVVFLTVDVSK